MTFKSERQDRCETCRWWRFDETGANTVPLGDEDAFGGCHRFPPTIDPTADDRGDPIVTSFPQVYCWEFCGEWTPAMPGTGTDRGLLASPIQILNLSVRGRKTMVRLGIVTIGDLTKKTEQELRETRNCGETTVNEILKGLQERGLYLAH